jgi:competence protein ComEA
MAIEDFEWEGDVEVAVTEPRGCKAEVARPSLLSRLRQSVWLEPALRLGGVSVLLGVLAGIGVVATTYAKPGLPLPDGARPFTAALGTSWLKPTEPHAAAAPSGSVAAPTAATRVTETAPSGLQTAPPEAPPVAVAGLTPDGKVILNAASADELTKLPGVGMKRAQAIVALRTKLKRFKQATDLLRVKGIGPRGLQRMLPHLVLDAPAAG